jgi:HemX protein
MPLNTVLVLVSMLFINSAQALPASFKSPYFPFHVSLSLAAYVFFFASLLSAIIYLKQFRDIKLKRQSLLYGKLPSLENMEHYIHTTAVIGWNLLAIGVIVGFIWVSARDIPFSNVALKIGSSLIALSIYLGLLIIRRVKKAGGKRMAYVSIAGFTWIVITLSLGKHGF